MDSNLTFMQVPMTEWEEFEKSQSNINFFQSTMRVKKRERMGYQNYILGVKDGDKLIAGGVLLGRANEFWMAYGPLIDWNDSKLVEFFLTNLAKFAKTKKMLKVDIFPNLLLNRRTTEGEIIEHFDRDEQKRIFRESGWRYRGETVKYEMKAGRWTYVKNLDKYENYDEFYADSYAKRTKKHLRHLANRAEFEMCKLSRGDLSKFVEILHVSDEANHVTTRDIEYFENLFDSFGEKVDFLTAKQRSSGELLAGSVVIWYNQEVWLFVGGVRRGGGGGEANLWLKDQIFRLAFERGFNRVNFGWIEGDFTNNSLLSFKAKFGGGVEEYVGGFELVLRPAALSMRKISRRSKMLVKKLVLR